MATKIYFSDEKIFENVSEILKNNGIYESVSDIADKEKGRSLIFSVLDLIENYAKGDVSMDSLIAGIAKELAVTEQIAKNIATETKEKILPYAEKIEVVSVYEGRPEETSPKNYNSDESTDNSSKKILREPQIPPEKSSKIKLKPKTYAPPKKESRSGPDVYREPLN